VPVFFHPCAVNEAQPAATLNPQPTEKSKHQGTLIIQRRNANACLFLRRQSELTSISMRLKNPRDEASGLPHVAAVGFAQSADQSLFFNVDAPKRYHATGQENEQPRRPVGNAQGET
jgi:hypothetical protein